MRIGKNGLDLIKSFEGLRLEAYLCPAGVPTIGYGHTSGVVIGQKITEQQAEDFLRQDLETTEAAVNSYVMVPLTQNQYDALVSFTFNLGPGNLKMSHLLRYVNEGEFQNAANEFERWVFARGEKLNGLVRRREAEKVLFLTKDSEKFLDGVPEWAHDIVMEAKEKGITTDLRKTAAEVPIYQLLLLVKKFFS